jgi:hypothetical protein
MVDQIIDKQELCIRNLVDVSINLLQVCLFPQDAMIIYQTVHLHSLPLATGFALNSTSFDTRNLKIGSMKQNSRLFCAMLLKQTATTTTTKDAIHNSA